MKALRGLVTVLGLLAAWQALVWVTALPPFILPSPLRVIDTLIRRWEILLDNAAITLVEILLGLVLGVALGTLSAVLLAQFRLARRWLLPIFVASQAIPAFALAPLLVLWLGYGMASKIAVATLIIYFPVTSALYDGLRRTDPGWLDLAVTMNGTRLGILREIRLPAALPAFASGVRLATAAAPIGAVIGEWVGSSAGLGFLMLHANGRMQIDLLFAALLILAAMALTLYAAMDALLRAALPWQPDQLPAEGS
jgi:putative hydroxymethylpyrimidine transport system permease protein